MEITFLKMKEQESLKKEPYKSIAEKFQKMDSIYGNKVEIDIEDIFEEEETCFYTQGYCFSDGKLLVEFESINNPDGFRDNILVMVKLKLQLLCSDDRDVYEMAIRCIKRKFPYFYISDASHLSLQFSFPHHQTYLPVLEDTKLP